MRKQFTRLVCYLLAISIILPTVTMFSVYADSLDEESLEAMDEAYSPTPTKAGKWGEAIADGLVPPWNAFHNKVGSITFSVG